MRLLVDMQCMQSGSSKGGIGRYAYSLLEAMVHNNKNHEISILLNNELPMHNYEKLLKLIPKERIYKFYTWGDTREYFKDNYTKSELAKLCREYTISMINPDMLFIMSLFEGLYEKTVTSVGEIFPANRTVVILYDLIPLVEKEKYLTSAVVDKHYMSKIFYLIQAGLLLSISQFSKDEAMHVLKIPENQITNISSAIDKKFQKIDIEESIKSKLFEKYGIRDKFLMFTGSYDIRKNQKNLIRSFAALEHSTRARYQLVIIGTGSSSVLEKLKALVKKLGFKNEEVIFLGYVSDEELLYLYNLTSLFVFPPLQEGFGLPALEAMSCGVPTIGSNTTSIPEVINKADALFNPYDVNCITSRMTQVLEDENFAKELVVHGLAQAKNFSWDKSALVALKAIEERYDSLEDRFSINYKYTYDTLLDKISKIEDIRKTSENSLIKASNILAQNKKEHKRHIGIISTYNTRCGIASYTKYVADSFLDRAIILAPYVYKEQLTTKDESFVYRSWHINKDDFKNLLQIVKDEKLDTIFIQFNYGFYGFYDLNYLIDSLCEIGVKVNITLHSTTDDTSKKDKSLAILSTSLKRCQHIFVHTQKDIANLHALDIKEHIYLVNQGIIDITTSKIKNKTTQFKIATYGFFLESKGLINIIKAFKLLLDRGYNSSLLMLNAKYSDAASNHLIKNANDLIKMNKLENFIELNTDYLSDEETISRLSKTDLVVYPYADTNESSSAAVRMAIAAKTDIAITPQQIFEEVKEFAFVFESESIEDITNGLENIIQETQKQSLDINKRAIKREKFREENLYSKISKNLKELLL